MNVRQVALAAIACAAILSSMGMASADPSATDASAPAAATPATTAVQPTAPATTTATATPAPAATSTPESASVQADLDKVVCRQNQVATGSRLGATRVCHTQRQWAEIQHNSQDQLSRNQINRGINTP
ncbi:MAG TPA: hypothetical protein VH000_07290 [Rhizomicrobium sp.]|nr:hypothetical protein [Rhizomicrobium sp.]